MDLIFINGFLGSGKTTLMNKILAQGEKIGVIVNDFGDVNVDSELIDNEVAMIHIENGSIFCSCNSHQFVESLIAMNDQDLDLLVVESSGFANPGSLNNVIDQLVEAGQLQFDDIVKVTVIDPVTFHKTKRLLPVQRQIDIADIILINKTDLVSEEELKKIEFDLLNINQIARIVRTQYSGIDLANLMRKTKIKNIYSFNETSRDVSFKSLTIQFKTESVSKETLVSELQKIATDVYRVKGYLLVDNQVHYVEVVSQQVLMKPVNRVVDNFYLVFLYSIKDIGKKEIFNRISKLPIT